MTYACESVFWWWILDIREHPLMHVHVCVTVILEIWHKNVVRQTQNESAAFFSYFQQWFWGQRYSRDLLWICQYPLVKVSTISVAMLLKDWRLVHPVCLCKKKKTLRFKSCQSEWLVQSKCSWCAWKTVLNWFLLTIFLLAPFTHHLSVSIGWTFQHFQMALKNSSNDSRAVNLNDQYNPEQREHLL